MVRRELAFGLQVQSKMSEGKESEGFITTANITQTEQIVHLHFH